MKDKIGAIVSLGICTLLSTAAVAVASSISHTLSALA